MAKMQSAKAQAMPLDTKLAPTRAGGVSTFEALLATAGDLLGEVGFESLSTNLICSRAGMTPPALYRYFPNKYAVLKELGRRLMKAQDDAVFAWIDAGGLTTRTQEEAVESYKQIQTQVIDISRAHPGGIWIMRALRAAPILHAVQTESRDDVAQHLADAARDQYPSLTDEQLLAATRVSTQMMYGAIEMALESPELEQQITSEACWMVSAYYAQLEQRYARGGRPTESSGR
ncbi:MAG TPA: TetR/AcrR family transcriptional regulator [Caulobacteraceae bacterium]|nr:TetR/AcrR family transcriptional regulator [Caulobacteraceae bacterium]